MTPNLVEALYIKYPEFIESTSLPYSVECGDGWFYLIDRACMKVKDALTDYNEKVDSFKLTQIKEKYGALRIYSQFFTENEFLEASIDSIINEAELESAYTCEVCGSSKGARIDGLWLVCRCFYCANRELAIKRESIRKRKGLI